jgi:hypothetical protein
MTKNNIVPPQRPLQSLAETRAIIAAHQLSEDLVLVGVRGYYRDSMGATGKNDRNIYDDAVFVVSPHVFAAFNANTDPSLYRQGTAVLQTGVYRLVKHRHRGRYPALQIVKDVILRDGSNAAVTGRHGINFHYGAKRGTASAGCQTVPRPQWSAFISLVYNEMRRSGQQEIPYILIERK